MTIEAIKNEINAECYSDEVSMCQEVKGVFVGDVLSLAMAHAKEGQIWVTVQGHLNAVAVAVLIGMPAILLVQGIKPSEAMKLKAKEEGIVLLGSDKSAYEVIKILAKWL